MGARCLICVVYRGKFVVAQYTQCHGYLEVQGARIVKFLLVPGNVERLRNGLAHIFTPTEKYMAEVYRQVAAEYERRTGRRWHGMGIFPTCDVDSLYPSLSPGIGAGILEIIALSSEEEKVPIQMQLEFANVGWHCENAYVIDLDHEVFECYSGYLHSYEVAGIRFLGVGCPTDSEIHTVPGLLTEFSFEQIALMNSEKDFLAVLFEDEDDDVEDK